MTFVRRSTGCRRVGDRSFVGPRGSEWAYAADPLAAMSRGSVQAVSCPAAEQSLDYGFQRRHRGLERRRALQSKGPADNPGWPITVFVRLSRETCTKRTFPGAPSGDRCPTSKVQ